MGAASSGKLRRRNRSKTITLRLDPVLLYMAEISARMSRRTMTSVIEGALKTALENEVLKEVQAEVPRTRTNDPIDKVNEQFHPPERVYETKRIPLYSQHAVDVLWHVEEADRVAQLALHDQRLLTFDEQLLWSIIRESPQFWNVSDDGRRYAAIENLNRPVLRQKWPLLKKVALEGADPAVLEGEVPRGQKQGVQSVRRLKA